MLDRLGPDLCESGLDLDTVLTRLASLDPGTELAAALLDQRVAAGIGNVFKSEVCWAERISPFTPLGALDEDTRRRIYETARDQLSSNLTVARRTTYGNGLAVYGKGGRRCPRCRATIESRRDLAARSTYWCPQCQPPLSSASGAAPPAPGRSPAPPGS
jgi:endonuclease-8